MPIVKMPDGKTVKFPDDMTPDEISSVLDKEYGKVSSQKLMQSHETKKPRPEGPTVDNVLRESARIISPLARPVLQGGGSAFGSIGGGVAGAAGGPPGVVAGGIVGGVGGYVLGDQMADALDMYAGIKKPYASAGENFQELMSDVEEGTLQELIGRGPGLALKGGAAAGKWVAGTKAGKKITAPVRAVAGEIKKQLTEKGMQSAAAKAIADRTSKGPIYSENAAKAMDLEKEIQGLGFDMAQRTDDPKLIMLRRALVRKGDNVDLHTEQLMKNDRAILQYFKEKFGYGGTLDDLLTALEKNKQGVESGVAEADKVVKKAMGGLQGKPPMETGEAAVSAIDTAKAPVQQTLDDLGKRIPDEPVNFERTRKSVENLLNRKDASLDQQSAVESFQKGFNKLVQKGETAHTAMGVNRTLNDMIDTNLGAGKKSAAEALGEIKSALKADLDAIPPGGSVGKAMREFNEFASKEYFGRFEKGALKEVMGKGTQASGLRTRTENIANRFTTPSGADDLIRAVGKDKATEIMRGYYHYDFVREMGEEITEKKLNKWLADPKTVTGLNKYGIRKDFEGVETATKSLEKAKLGKAEFEASAAARMLNSDVETAIGSAIKSGHMHDSMKQLINAAGNDKAARKGLENAFAEHLMKAAREASERVGKSPLEYPAKVIQTVQKYKPAMRALYTKDQIKAIENIQDAYLTQARGNRSPIGGDSGTAELSFMQRAIDINILNRFWNITKGLYRGATADTQKKIDEITIRALFDPEYAKFIKTVTSKPIPDKQLKTMFNNKIIDLDAVKTARSGRMAAGVAAMSMTEGEDED